MPNSLIHLICGSTGAGKTTYAARLAEEMGGVVFSIDQWMTALYWIDAPQPIAAEWSMERVDRCYRQIWAVAAQVAARGVPCVLDLGFTRFRDRDRIGQRRAAAGLSVRLHVLYSPADERWRRVQGAMPKRAKPNQLDFTVTREMFDFVESMWEPPSAEEMAACEGVLIQA